MQRVSALLLRFRLIAALLAGGVSALGFAPWGLWPLTLACIALLIWLTAQAQTKRQAFLTGWAFGIGHFCWGLQWIAVAFTYQAAMPEWLGYLAVFLLSLYLSVYPGLAALGAWWVREIFENTVSSEPPDHSEGESRSADHNIKASFDGRLPEGKLLRTNGAISPVSLPYILAFAAFWIITEWLRSWVFTGFAWNPLSVAVFALDDPLALHAAAISKIIGTYGLSGLLALLAGLPLLLLQPKQREEDMSSRDIFLDSAKYAALVLLFAAFLYWSAKPLAEDKGGGKAPAITVVQPNINQDQRYDPLEQGNNVQKLARYSKRPADAEPRLLFWSESALPWYLEDGYPFRYYQGQPGETASDTRRAVAGLLGPDDILITGNDRLRFDKDGQLVGAHNSVTALNAKGELLGWYDKAHLVPYGEYLPLAWLLKPLGLARLVPGDIYFWPGPGPRTLALGSGRPKMGVQVCYEIIFSGQVADRTNRPDFIFNPSNDAWFGTVGPPQFTAQARLRAVEEGLPVIRATPTGISSVINAHGKIERSLPLGKAGAISARLPKPHPPTLFARHGNILPLGFALLLLGLALFLVARARFAR